VLERVSVRHWAAAAVITIATAGAAWRMYTLHPMVRLAHDVPREARFVTARISGFRWAAVADRQRSLSRLNPLQLQIRGAAGSIINDLAADERISSRHAVAVAYLLANDPEGAVRIFERVPERDRNARQWNDLAAAHHTLAERTGSLDELTDALVAADQSLRAEPLLAEGLFNRAVILEAFHLRDAAAAAWRSYLTVDGTSEWAGEARQRLRELEAPLPAVEAELTRLQPRLERGDAAAARMLLHLDPGDVRYVVQTQGFARWGEAWLSGDLAKAERALTAVRTVGAALAAFNGEPTLGDSVAVIDQAQGRARDALARGHVAFRDGRVAFRPEKNFVKAEALLEAAVRELESGGSPLAMHARFFGAVAIQIQGRVPEAEAAFAELVSTAPREAAALHGYAHWQLASCFMGRAEWGVAIRHLEQAIGRFESLREAGNVAYLHDILSQVYDAIGDRESAGRSRLLALRHHGKRSTQRLEHVISGMIYDASRRKAWRAARSLLDVEVEIAGHVRDPELQANAFLRRALVATRLGEPDAAVADLRYANAQIASAKDTQLRKKLEADRDTAAALIAEDPAVAVRLLTNALRIHGSDRGWRMLLPDLYLRRGRMHLRLGDREQAAQDFEAGIAELEQHRESLPAGDARWGVLGAADELFDEAIEISLRDGGLRAFEYAERERARSLLDRIPQAAPFDPAVLPQDIAIVEYAVLPRKLVIFAVDREGQHTAEREIAVDDLTWVLDRFRDAVRTGASEREKVAREAYELLIAPVAHVVERNRVLAVVPDSATAATPFGALANPHTSRYLADERVLSIVPSARFVQARRAAALTPRKSILIVADPAGGELARLPGAVAEARVIAKAYDDARTLSGERATARAFLGQVAQVDVIHFAGHGILSRDSAALVLASAEGADGRLDMKALSRLQVRSGTVVVIAACDSSRGPSRGEAALGVAYAFGQAGASAVIATLWPISDRDAALFFPRLHQRLAAGLSPAEALRLTQLECVREQFGDRSSFWAAVQCIGC